VSLDLIALIATAILVPVLTAPYFVGRCLVPGGLKWALSNRETPMQFPPWITRAQRAQANLLENLPTFAVLVLVAHSIGKANHWTDVGALVFLGCRVVHAIVYIFGWTGVRSLAYVVSLGAELLILVQLFA
jgi:uncharacterized MAPEG superfamily protein